VPRYEGNKPAGSSRIAGGITKIRGITPAQSFPTVRPFAPQAAVVIHDADMGALAAHAELLRRTDREGDGRIAARDVAVFGILELKQPNVVLPHDVVPGIEPCLLPHRQAPQGSSLPNLATTWMVLNCAHGPDPKLQACVGARSPLPMAALKMASAWKFSGPSIDSMRASS